MMQPLAAQAGCSTDGGTTTCSGSDIPVLDENADTGTTYIFQDVTKNFGPTDAGEGSYAFTFTDTGSEGSDATKNKHEDGQDGGGGSGSASLSATMHYDLGFGLDSATGGFRIDTRGGDGGRANENSAFGTAYGGVGGGGGSGGDVTIEASADGGGKTPYPITTADGPGILAVTQGGDGGLGGKGTNQSGLHQGFGGAGGAGGDGGDISVSLADGHTVDITTGASAGIALVSIGGEGNTAGEGLSDNKATGGTGGAGGNGGAVTLTATETGNSITTSGEAVHGIVAISQAGDGGTGGEGHGTDDGVGGNGGHGGTAGDISVNYAGDITTADDKAQGILSQSIGGAGGSGGDGKSWFDGNGGYPSDPGPGGKGTVSFAHGTITTKGNEASGILVESVGGFAGESGGASGFVAYGANGGSGGDGDTVSASLDSASIGTSGDYSAGLIALSTGGGGGIGSQDDGFVSIGAKGGAGGVGGDVSVTLSGTNSITTKGKDAPGIMALSVGGGGGASGGNDGVVALGGQGGQGGNAGNASVTVGGDTTIGTSGDYSVGVMVASIGNGGGKSTSPKGAWALGANGGGGGSGHDVGFDLKSGTLKVTTGGAMADGVLISSVGGGGGHGGSSLDAIAIIAPAAGTSGGDGGSGGDINVTTESGAVDIETQGHMSNGFVVQSVGGGGGTGGNVVSVNIGLTFNQQTASVNSDKGHHGGTVTVGDQDTSGLTGSVVTHGDMSSGILVQSIGGGGGSAGNNIEAGVSVEFNHDMGTDGGEGGEGGAVTVNSTADATTYGDHSDGILVQSVGGGGGQSSNVVDANAGVNVSQFVGNQGSSAGDAGTAADVWVKTDSKVATSGDNAMGIVAQSVGGGGGKAGYTVDGDVSINAGSITLGSTGGTGGAGGAVTLTSGGSVTTKGHLSHGIVAQSIAGGGGTSGTTVGGNAGISIGYTHGGDGGAGGTASDVILTNSADVATQGAGADGAIAQSLGGGGGAGGLTASASFSFTGDVNVAHGGNGGTGGTAGKATLTNTGSVSTTGNTADGLFVQSVGGSGGAGGFLGTGAGSAGLISASVNVSVGGDGGAGGKADAAEATNSGAITTAGYSATGITVQSIGGNGGDGGAVVAAAIDLSSDGGGAVNVSVGGDGGDAGAAGAVSVTNQSGGDITTTGHMSYGLFAQSIGGNGGKGGGSYAFTLSGSTGPTVQTTVSIGGSGGNGSKGNTVDVENDATIRTSGGNAHGIYAQSVGGNGGVGAYGFAFGGDFYWKPGNNNLDVDVNVTVGGSGGTGADAAKVTITNTGDIDTKTETSYGLYAQSVGGGGGDGGQAGSHTFGYTKKQTKTDEAKSYSLNFTLGGDSGAAGDGNDVEVTHSSGTISTAGNAAYAILAQSVGGGGGNSGNGSPGLKGWVADIYNTFEWLDDMYDLYKEVKGFPGKELSFEIDIGGKAGAAGHGGDVEVSNDGVLKTTGDSGTAIYAQSVGGGGGSGGDGSQGLLTSFTVARSGSGGGDGGNVSVTNSGTITTGGAGAMGIYAQSVGGGGGTAGDIEGNIVTALGNFYETAGAELFGKDNGGNGGNGGNINIDVTSSGSITTTNENAHGIWVQSVGGSGGSGGTLNTQAITGSYQNGIGSAGDAGNGGYVDIAMDGTVDVKGDGAHGIFAQSASGSDGYTGGVKMRISGTVTAEGKNARAILSQSSETGDDDPDGNNAGSEQCKDTDCRGTSHIYVEKSGLVRTTNSGAYETIGISGGRSIYNSDGSIDYSNLVQVEGTVESADMESVVIANDDQGALRIHNWGGTISGSLQLSDSNRSEFVNMSGAVFNAGSTVYLGELGNYTGDSGSTMSPHGQGTVGTSTVSLGQTYAEAGTIQIDAAQASGGSISNDLIAFDGLGKGATIALTGQVKPVWTGSTALADGDSGKLVFATLKNDASLKTLSAKVSNSTTVTYSLGTESSDTQVYLNYSVDYSGKASGVELRGNALKYATFFGSAMSSIKGGASGRAEDALGQLATDILNVGSTDELERLYTEQAPEEHLIGASRAISTAHALNRALQSCPTIDPTQGLDFLRQTNCEWITGTGSRLHQDRTDESPEFDETAWGLALGVQREIETDTFIELAGQAETLSATGRNFSQSGQRYAFGAALKREIGAVTLSTTLTGGLYSLDYDRNYSVTGTGYRANADIKGRFLGAEIRASKVLTGQNGFYFKPSAALAYTRIWQDGYTETGDGPLNWQVGSVNEDWMTFTPMVEFGRALSFNDRSALAFLRVGVTAALNDPSLSMTSTLAGASASLGDLDSVLGTDRYQGDLAAGFEVQLEDNLTLSLLGRTAISENSRDFGGRARIEFRF